MINNIKRNKFPSDYNKSTGGIPHCELGCGCKEGFQDLCENHIDETGDCKIALERYRKLIKNKEMSKKKEYPIEKVSRTEMVKKIHETKGRFFTATHIGVDLQPHTLNCIRSKTQGHQLGYITVHARKKGVRLINPQTLKEVTFKGVRYQLKK